jgi:hypothetical protein
MKAKSALLVTALEVLCALAILLVAPHAYADTNRYLTCLAQDRIFGASNTELALGTEAYNAVITMKNSHVDQPYVLESLALQRKYNLSDHVAASIVGSVAR